ncbi:MAG: diphosphomevalonate decarboxylase [Thermoplasmata archaeon]|nr:diphosphomevalonate decarboxylase [Thermoplasmata archaeon]
MERAGGDRLKATAEARANIALVKYWGQADAKLNLPLTDSLSMTVDKLVTTTTVEADPALKADTLAINGVAQQGAPLARASRHMDRLRERAKNELRCRIASTNSFAASAGMASSASGFAALTVAGLAALGVQAAEREMTTLARLGSGSAARSIHGGFVAWHAGPTHESSFAEQVAPPSQVDLHDVVVVLSEGEKKVGSAEGHGLAGTSPLNAGRVARVPHLLAEVRAGLAARDVARIGRAAEEDAILMHAVMMTSTPSLLYWSEGTVAGLHAVRAWREDGLGVWATIDAGPNLHLLCAGRDAPEVARRAREMLSPASVVDCAPGEGARLLTRHLF